MTDNTQPDHIVDMHEMVVDNSLDGILDKMGYPKNTDLRKNSIRLITDWHNKQTLELLDRLETQALELPLSNGREMNLVDISAIEAERNKLNPSKSTPFNKLKEVK